MSGASLLRGALLVLAVAVTACGVQPTSARVAGVGPDTRPGALASENGAETAGDRPTRSESAAEQVSPAGPTDAGTIAVLLFDADGPVWIEREAVQSTGDPVADAVATLARPLTGDEQQAGLRTDVPARTVLAGYSIGSDRAVLEVDGATAGGTDPALWRRSRQLACTARFAAADGVQIIEVRLDGEPVATFDAEAEPCP